MTSWKNRSRKLGCAVATAIALGGMSWAAMAPAARAQEVLFEEQGTLRPMEDSYTFSGTAGQAVTITMTSPEFDTVLVLRDSSNQDVAFNDDYARSLNSTIVTTLPATGEYTVVARSFSGQGGPYALVVRPATAYDQAYASGMEAIRNGDLEAAMTAFTEAIRLEPNQPVAYLDRGDAYYGQNNLPAVIADYTRAADLYEQAGDMEMAQSLREQITYLQSPPEGEPMP